MIVLRIEVVLSVQVCLDDNLSHHVCLKYECWLEMLKRSTDDLLDFHNQASYERLLTVQRAL